MRDSSSCNVGNNLCKHFAVSGLFTKVVPMFRSHAKGSPFVESQHAFERDRDELSNLGKKDV